MSRQSQTKRILDLLLAEAPNEVSLTTLMNLRIASLTRRISDLRQQGYRIENRKQVVDGVTHSWYSLTGWDAAKVDGSTVRVVIEPSTWRSSEATNGA